MPAHGLQLAPGHPLHFYGLLSLVSWRKPPPVVAFSTRFESFTGFRKLERALSALKPGTWKLEPLVGALDKPDLGF
ncbi:MAG: hypothetical protein O7D93_09115 [Acidobacteria bacterium]|nr:hypothetical protein [Acidobacteriota bacterium]